MATYKVFIMGKEYNLTSEDNKDYTEKLAEALDKRIRSMRARFSSLSVTDCAVLTALDCMDELGQQNRNIDNIRTQIKDYVDDAGRARNQAAAAQREIKILQERIEQLEKELSERTNFGSSNNVGEAVSAEDMPVVFRAEYSESEGVTDVTVTYRGKRYDPLTEGDELSVKIVKRLSSSSAYSFDSINRVTVRFFNS